MIRATPISRWNIKVEAKGAPAQESHTGGRLVSPRISLEKNF